ncbi:MAG: hypothetical protein GOMPHAMPRED_004621 [Gomphillus americanus]|uniref:RING-type domain-containing protein n=1 Tax=Gomphillus americanus TaxID=1940652 RepID=A0A8H3FP42_9LECA|nr:MAG: hypothetical protein GOMPHAMPRED_004621 [Gomphillus americanus]
MQFRKKLSHGPPCRLSVEDKFSTDVFEPYDFYEGTVLRMQQAEITSAQPDYKDQKDEDDPSTNISESCDIYEGIVLRMQLKEIASAELDYKDKTAEDDFSGTTPEPYDSFDGMLLRRQLEEIEHVQPDRKGKGREISKSDAEIAWNLQQVEMQHVSTLASDEQIARSMAMALEADMEAIARIAIQDAMSFKDRELAMVLHEHEERILGLKNNAPQTLQQEAAIVSYQKNLDRAAMAKSFQSYQKPEHPRTDHRIPTAESSRTAMKRKPVPLPVSAVPSVRPDQQECTACTDELPIFDLANLPCGHDYCKACLSKLFFNAIIDESEFPPRCCKTNIIQDYISMFLDSSIAAKFDAKKEEFSTINRTYCQNSKCATFIPKSRIMNDVGRCPGCEQGTCTICNKASHGASECPGDPALLSTSALAKEQRWQYCGKCWALVELKMGCHHIT